MKMFKIKFDLKLYFLIFLLFFFGTTLYKNLLRAQRIEDTFKQKQLELEKARDEQIILKEKLEKVTSEYYIENQIRDKLGLAKEGEIVLILPPDDVLRGLAMKEGEEDVFLPDPNWKKWLKLFGF